MPVFLNNPGQGRNFFLPCLALFMVLGLVQGAEAQNRKQSAKPAEPASLSPRDKAQQQPFPLDDNQVCAQETEKAERSSGIPLHLLQAISHVESGRWDAKGKSPRAWPWTVMAKGKGRYLPNKAAAIAEVMALQAKGVKNIDVGCMQVNLHYHPQAFADLEQAFTPAVNVTYAAGFLKKLRQEMRSWTMAVGRYHSANDHFASPYRSKVVKAWRTIQKNVAKAQQRKRKQQHQERLALLRNKAAKKKKPTAGGNSLDRLARRRIKTNGSAESPSPKGLAAVKRTQSQASANAEPVQNFYKIKVLSTKNLITPPKEALAPELAYPLFLIP